MSQSNLYDVYGLGNALVDIEFEISADVLAQIGVEKGIKDSSFAHFILKSETLFLPFKFSGNGIECIKTLKCQ